MIWLHLEFQKGYRHIVGMEKLASIREGRQLVACQGELGNWLSAGGHFTAYEKDETRRLLIRTTRDMPFQEAGLG